jgi:hypothetical protein
VDLAGNVIVTGQTASSNFPVVNALSGGSALSGISDAFFVQMTPASGLLTSSYLGGSGADAGTAAAGDYSGNGYFAGWTGSTNFPTVGPLQGGLAGGYDAFVSKIAFGVAPPVFTSISPDTGAPAADQRGVAWPRDGDRNGSRVVDIGAFEKEPARRSVRPSGPACGSAGGHRSRTLAFGPWGPKIIRRQARNLYETALGPVIKG